MEYNYTKTTNITIIKMWGDRAKTTTFYSKMPRQKRPKMSRQWKLTLTSNWGAQGLCKGPLAFAGGVQGWESHELTVTACDKPWLSAVAECLPSERVMANEGDATKLAQHTRHDSSTHQQRP